MIDRTSLEALAVKFTIGLASGSTPLRPILTIQSPPEAQDVAAPDGQLPIAIPDVDKTVTSVDVVPRLKVDFSFVGKWVRSGQIDLPGDPAQESPIGGMPIVGQLVTQSGNLTIPLSAIPPPPTPSGTLTSSLTTALPPNTLMMSKQGNADVAGVPELLGRLACTISEVVERVTETPKSHRAQIAVEWTVVDDLGSGVASSYLDSSGAPAALPAAPLTFPANGTFGTSPQLLSLTLVFPLLFSELTSSVPEVLRFTVKARIKLSVTLPTTPDPVKTAWISLPPVPLVIPTIPVPTILVLCEHENFLGRKLALVPNNSAVGLSAPGGISVGAALQLTASALRALLPGHSLLDFLAGGVPGGTPVQAAAYAVTSMIASPNLVIIVARSTVEDLSTEEFEFYPGWGPFHIGRFTADDRMNSIIAIGRPGTIFDMFRDLNLIESATRLQITLDRSLGCAIWGLDPNDPTPNIVYPSPTPTPSPVSSFSPRFTHADHISSVALRPPAGRFT